MMKFAMSPAAAGLLRAILAHCGAGPNRILLSAIRSTDWQSLTFVGERHQLVLRIPGPEPDRVVARLTAGIEQAEFGVPGHIVADIVLAGPPRRDGDGSILVELEALTVAD